jgi:hypothetical protein
MDGVPPHKNSPRVEFFFPPAWFLSVVLRFMPWPLHFKGKKQGYPHGRRFVVLFSSCNILCSCIFVTRLCDIILDIAKDYGKPGEKTFRGYMRFFGINTIPQEKQSLKSPV